MKRRKSYWKKKTSPCVYFIQEGDDGLIKIGMTNETVYERHQNLQLMNATALYIRGIIRDESPRALEAAIHQLFEAERCHGEWFKPSQEILDFIRNHTEKVKQASITLRVDDQKLCVECKQKVAVTKDGNLCSGCLKRWINKQTPSPFTRRKPRDESVGYASSEQDPSFENVVKLLEDQTD